MMHDATEEAIEIWPLVCTCQVPPTQALIGYCPEHGGAWSYKCAACWVHLRALEAPGYDGLGWMET